MLGEPCVHQSLYTDAVAIAAAESVEEALALLAATEEGWLIEELRRLTPKVQSLDKPALIFTDIRNE